jgi:hypothetical protein
MLVYGDRSRTFDPRDLLVSICDTVRRGAREPAGWRRQDPLRAALIAAGELAQGLADVEFEAHGRDDDTPLQADALALARAVAGVFMTAAQNRDVCPCETPLAAAAALRARALPPRITCKAAEGYAFYAVYPESYIAAASARTWTPPPAVIGLRSIGAGLAAAVASATGASLLVTLRPCGDPHRREVRVSPGLRNRLAAHAGEFLLVDEGPGLSGSSFGAVADLLESLGVGAERIVFLPSHAGDPGPRATAGHRARWRRSRRLVSTLDDLIAAEPLAAWFADLVGEVSTVQDLSGGLWRLRGGTARRAPTWAAQERRKFRLTAASGVYLARFAGLGQLGQAKFERAQALHAAGFTPEPVGLRRGFLLERWARGRGIGPHGPHRAERLDRLGCYLGFRARRFPASPEDGASFEALRTMVAANAAALGGADLGAAVGSRLDGAGAPAGLRPVHVDGRLQTWEWLQGAAGRLIKTDAIDHSCAHDLIGCQDIAWDVAGAASEWRLAPAEIASLTGAVSRHGAAEVSPVAVEAFRICYAAFQAGYWSLAAEGAPAADRRTLTAWRDRHLADLRRLARR